MKIIRVRLVARLRYLLGLLCLVLLMAAVPAALAQEQAPAATETPPHQVELLLDLLRDPAVQQWLEQQPKAAETAEAPAPVPQDRTVAGYFAHRLQYLRDNLALL